jgi:hypothetical protein
MEVRLLSATLKRRSPLLKQGAPTLTKSCRDTKQSFSAACLVVP